MIDPKFVKDLAHKLGPGGTFEKPPQIFVEEGDAYVNLYPVHHPQEAKDKQEPVVDEQKVIEAEILEKYDEVSFANNSSTTKDKYQGRVNFKQVYNDFQEKHEPAAAFDLWYKWPYYGRTSLKGEASKIFLDRASAATYLTAVDDVLAPRFILPTLEKIKREFLRRKLSISSTFLREIKFKRGYEDEDQFFNKHLDNLFNVFFNQVLINYTTSPDIKNIDDFYQVFKHFMTQDEKKFTLSSFFESNKYVPYSSGLVYDVYNGDPTSDEEKIEFYNDANFKVYVYIAKMHGCAIDPNIPWRMVVDLSDKYWRDEQGDRVATYFSKINKALSSGKKNEAPTSAKELFEDLFEPCANYYNFNNKYNGFVLTLNKFYERFIDKDKGYPRYYTNISITEKEGSVRLTKTNSSARVREKILDPFKKINIVKAGSTTTASNIIDARIKVDNKYLNWYLEIRNIEKGQPLNNRKIKILKKQINQIYNFAKAQETKEFFKFANIVIKYIEFALGTTNANVKKNPIFLLNQINEPIAKVKIAERKPLATIEKDGKISIPSFAGTALADI